MYIIKMIMYIGSVRIALIKMTEIDNVIPFISFPLGVSSLVLLLIDLTIQWPQVLTSPSTHLVLITAFTTTTSIILLSFRGILTSFLKLTSKK